MNKIPLRTEYELPYYCPQCQEEFRTVKLLSEHECDVA